MRGPRPEREGRQRQVSIKKIRGFSLCRGLVRAAGLLRRVDAGASVFVRCGNLFRLSRRWLLLLRRRVVRISTLAFVLRGVAQFAHS